MVWLLKLTPKVRETFTGKCPRSFVRSCLCVECNAKKEQVFVFRCCLFLLVADLSVVQVLTVIRLDYVACTWFVLFFSMSQSKPSPGRKGG